MLTYNDLINFAQLPLNSIHYSFNKCFSDSLNTYPSNFYWFDESYTKKAISYYNLNSAISKLYLSAIKEISNDENLKQLFWLYYYILYKSDDPYFNTWEWSFPTGTEIIGNKMFLTVVVLSAMDIEKEKENSSILPKETLEMQKNHVLSIINKSILKPVDRDCGLSSGSMGWCAIGQKGYLFEIDGYKFELGSVKLENIAMLKNYYTNNYLLVSTGDNFNATGSNPTLNNKCKFSTKFLENKNSYICHPISPYGYCSRRSKIFTKDQWYMDLRDRTPCLHIHIASNTLNANKAIIAYKKSLLFVKNYYPNFIPRLFCGASWILSNNILEMLPHNSNLIEFRSTFYCFPYNGNDEDFLRFIFNTTNRNYKTLPENTSLQRKCKQALLNGDKLKISRGIFPVEYIGNQLSINRLII